MPVVFAVIGLVLGAMTGSFAGALAVAALGYAIGLHITFKQRIDELEHGIELVRLARERRDAGDPEPAPARTPEPRVAPVYQRGDPPVPDPAAAAAACTSAPTRATPRAQASRRRPTGLAATRSLRGVAAGSARVAAAASEERRRRGIPARHQLDPRLVPRRQHRRAHRRGGPVHRRRLPAQVRRRPQPAADRIPSRRRCARRRSRC